MRFVCDSCRAQYMISDEKVGAKGVKVRCKKCGYIILVRQTDGQEMPPPEPQQELPQEEGAPDADDGLATQVMMNPLGSLPEGAEAPPADPETTSPGTAPGVSAKSAGPLGGLDDDEIGAVFDQVLSTGDAKKKESEEGGDSLSLGDDDDHMSTRVIDADMVKRLAEESGAGGELKQPDEPKKQEPAHEWFVAIDDEQVGPLTVDKLKDRWNQGEIGPDSLCWRAGLSDWLPLSEVSELAAVLAPRPSKPVIVAPPAAGGPVVSVPVESAFSAGGVAKTIRSEVQVPLATAPVEETGGGWKPSAASALASLVQEEIAAISRPPPPAAAAEDEVAVTARGLLDLPPPDERPAAAKPNGSSAGHISTPPSPQQHYSQPPPGYSAPGFNAYRPAPQRNNMVIGLAAGGGAVLLLLIGLVIYVVTREPRVIVQQPSAPVAAAPTPAPVPAEQPKAVAAPQAAQPAAVQPAAAPAQAPAQPQQQVAAAQPPPPPPPTPERTESRSQRSTRARESNEGASITAAAKTERTSKSEPEPSADDFEKEFGRGGSEPAASPKKDKKQPTTYVPPAPGGGGDLPDSLSQSAIMQVVLANRTGLARCADEQHKKEPGRSGTLVMQWTVQTNGKTSNVKAVSDEFKSTYMAGCVGGLIKGWTFPRHKTQGEPVKFPFKF